MARLVLTGATGYIGKWLLETARAEGHQVTVLGRQAPGGDVGFFSWSLGDPAPQAALRGADAVIHCAHDWRADKEAGENRDAAVRLAREALEAGVPRFVFASTTSARATARNAYGKGKFAAEGQLASLSDAVGRVVSARIALVYGGEPAGQYALMRKSTALMPILPMLGLDRDVQPIHLDEVCRALLTLARDPALREPYYVVGGEPIRFGQWLKLLRKVQTGGGLLLIPIPLDLVLLACAAFPFLPRERVLGLAGAEAMPSAQSLKALSLQPREPFAALMAEETRSRGSEARALLRYLGAAPTAEMERDLTLGLDSAGLSPLGLSPSLLKHPGLIALLEPPASRQAHRLAQALHLAAQVVEAHVPAARRPGFFRTAALVAVDLLTLPLRLATARRLR